MIYRTYNIEVDGNIASLQVMLYENSREFHTDKVRPMMLVCPGGGYAMTSDREADFIATQFLAKGCHAAVLRYTVAPARFPTQLLQLAKAVRLLRQISGECCINPNEIAVIGFSAGGHLAASLGVFWHTPLVTEALGCTPEEVKPNVQLLCYPVITSGEFAHRGSFNNLLGPDGQDKLSLVSLETQVTRNVPPTFLWHTWTDASVPVENSLFFASALRRAGVSCEMHIFREGVHGLALANKLTRIEEPDCTPWIQLACNWLEANFTF